MRSHTIILVLLITLLVACAPARAPTAAQETPPVQKIPDTPYTAPQAAPPPSQDPNPDMVTLTGKASTIKSYSFNLAPLPQRAGDLRYFVRGSKAKILLVRQLPMDGWSADTVFIDYETNTATAYCLTLSCKKEQHKSSVEFEPYAIKLPVQWLDEVKYATKVKALQYNSRPNTVVTWQNGALYYEAYLDNYYGFPQRVAIANDKEQSDIVGGYEYQEMTFNTVTEADVTPPY